MIEQISFNEKINNQKKYFRTGESRNVSFRIDQLKKLKSFIFKFQEKILDALQKDLRKPKFEAYSGEIKFVLKDIDEMISKLQKWSKHKKVSSPLVLFPSYGEIRWEPYGVVLIMGPWNYPFQLVISPLIGAMAAGNCVILKPSEVAPHTQKLIIEMINQNFASEYIWAVDGGRETAEALLKEPFDFIFFTGGTHIGKIVMEAASKRLTPLCLELGGKSPCIVDKETNVDVSSKRITWGKFFNAGQTCVAPDYLYVHESIKDAFLEGIKKSLQKFYGGDPKKSKDYARIINERHFERLFRLMKNGKTIMGGEHDIKDLYIAPTIIDEISWEDPIMQEEIFGPILPILTYTDLNQVIETINNHPKPLAFYFFSSNKENQEKVLSEISFGGGCINDCVLHLSNFNLPFGGVGESGMGAYHGRYSFEVFSHQKGVLKNAFWFDPFVRYAPYNKLKLFFVRKFL